MQTSLWTSVRTHAGVTLPVVHNSQNGCKAIATTAEWKSNAAR